MHGVTQACKCLGLDKSTLSNYDAASIIARLKYPEPRYDQVNKLKKIDLRTKYIVNRFNTLNFKEHYGTI